MIDYLQINVHNFVHNSRIYKYWFEFQLIIKIRKFAYLCKGYDNKRKPYFELYTEIEIENLLKQREFDVKLE